MYLTCVRFRVKTEYKRPLTPYSSRLMSYVLRLTPHFLCRMLYVLFCMWYAPGDSGTVVEKSFSNQKVASSIPCRSVLEQDTEPLIAPDVQCAISVNVK